jgi:hypothetical protein
VRITDTHSKHIQRSYGCWITHFSEWCFCLSTFENPNQIPSNIKLIRHAYTPNIRIFGNFNWIVEFNWTVVGKEILLLDVVNTTTLFSKLFSKRGKCCFDTNICWSLMPPPPPPPKWYCTISLIWRYPPWSVWNREWAIGKKTAKKGGGEYKKCWQIRRSWGNCSF